MRIPCPKQAVLVVMRAVASLALQASAKALVSRTGFLALETLAPLLLCAGVFCQVAGLIHEPQL